MSNSWPFLQWLPHSSSMAAKHISCYPINLILFMLFLLLLFVRTTLTSDNNHCDFIESCAYRVVWVNHVSFQFLTPGLTQLLLHVTVCAKTEIHNLVHWFFTCFLDSFILDSYHCQLVFIFHHLCSSTATMQSMNPVTLFLRILLQDIVLPILGARECFWLWTLTITQSPDLYCDMAMMQLALVLLICVPNIPFETSH